MLEYEKFLTMMLDGYRTGFDVVEHERKTEGLVAEAHMHVIESQCLIFKELQMWTADADEYVYIYRVPHLTDEICKKYMEESYKDGMPKIDLDHVSFKKQHMCTHLVALFLCDEVDDDALQRIKKCKIYKNFMFSLKGWMEMHAAVINLSTEDVNSNRYGKETAKYMRLLAEYYHSAGI